MRRILVGVLVLSMGLFLLPRTGAAQGVQLGFDLGLNMAKVSMDDLGTGESNSVRVAPAFGARIAFPIGTMFAIESGLNYSMKGTKYEYDGPIVIDDQVFQGKIESTTKLGYLTVPVMFKLLIPVEGMVRPYLKAGPEAGILVSAKDKTEYTVEGQSGSEDTDIKDDTKSFDLGLGFHGGVDLNVTPTMGLFGEAGYTLGLMDVSDEPAGVEDQSHKNRNFDISVGLMVHLQ